MNTENSENYTANSVCLPFDYTFRTTAFYDSARVREEKRFRYQIARYRRLVPACKHQFSINKRHQGRHGTFDIEHQVGHETIDTQVIISVLCRRHRVNVIANLEVLPISN